MTARSWRCPGCGQEVVPGDEAIVRAVEVVHEQSFGGEPSEPVEVGEAYFHRDHVPTEHDRYIVPGGS